MTKSLKVQVWLQQDKRCYWCEKPVIFRNHTPGEKMPDDAATIDHVYPKRHPKRREDHHKGRPSPFVIACHSCNNRRGGMSFQKFHELIGKEFQEPHAPRPVVVTRVFSNIRIWGFRKRRG